MSKKLADWVYENLEPRKSYNPNLTSYGLKHLAERAIGEYVKNEDMIQALVNAGYKVSADKPNSKFMATVLDKTV